MDDVKQRFAKTHIIIETILFIYFFLRILSDQTKEDIYGISVVIIIWGIDSALYFMRLYEKRKLLIVIRYVEIIITSAALVFTLHIYTSILLVVFMSVLIFEMIFLFDYSDIYSRTITCGVAIFPFAFFIVIWQLTLSEHSDNGAIDMICVIAMIIVFIAQISNLLVAWINSFERRVFEQRRMTESAKEMNETLKIHQEKIKKANEELGIQKIKMESANRQVRRVNAETQTQNEILKYISSSLEINDLVMKITDSVRKSLTLDFCAIIIRPNVVQNKSTIYRMSSDLPNEFETSFHEELIQGRFNDFINASKVKICNISQCKSLILLAEESLASMLLAPIIRDGDPIGALFCGHTKQDYFDESIGLFENVTAQILMALNNANLYATVQQLAIRDSLTGIYNRRHLNELFERYSNEAITKKAPISAALIDIDHFKGFNDTYGHLFGDYVLKKLSELADRIATEHEGIVSRYGGEEFVLVFPGKKIYDTYSIIEALQTSINNMQLDYEGVFVQVRVSIGITSYPEVCKTPNEVLNRADLAMYYSKEHGRNKITIDSDEVHAFFRAKNNEYQIKGTVKQHDDL